MINNTDPGAWGICRNRVTTTLVATGLPPGKKLFAAAGVSKDPNRLEAFARKCSRCPENIEVVRAASIGLEWRSAGTGRAVSSSEVWQKDHYAVIIDDDG